MGIGLNEYSTKEWQMNEWNWTNEEISWMNGRSNKWIKDCMNELEIKRINKWMNKWNE